MRLYMIVLPVIVSAVTGCFGTVSALHLTSFLMIFTLVSLIFDDVNYACILATQMSL